MNPVEIKRLNPEVLLPVYATPSAAAMDLRALIDGAPDGLRTEPVAPIVIAPGESCRIGTGLALNMGDANLAALILPRSSLGSRGIVLANTVGLIDADYQGELIVVLKNTGFTSFEVKNGDRIAQLMFIPIARPDLWPVATFSAATQRGAGGFGSTGIA